MSDSYLTIVPINVTREQVDELSQRVVDWLTEHEIISSNLTPCVFGMEAGYPPGLKYNDVINGEDFGLRSLRTNGLAITTKRQVFDNGGNGLEEVNCPTCGANNIDSDWGETVEAWDHGKNDKLECTECGNETSITAYAFKPSWAFGQFGLTFWNWPSLTSNFMNDLRKIIGKDITVIYGRL